MADHTAGPWHVGDGAQAVIVYASDGWAIANATTYHGGGTRNVQLANAQLIAEAPALLECLRDMAGRLSCGDPNYLVARAILQRIDQEKI